MYSGYPLNFYLILAHPCEEVEVYRAAGLKIYKVPYSTLAKTGIPQYLGARPGDVLKFIGGDER